MLVVSDEIVNMEWFRLSLNIVILSALTWICFLLVTFRIATASCKRQQQRLPPGPSGVPLIGNLSSFSSTSSLHRTLAALAVEYGPIFRLRLGTKLCIVLSSPSAASQALGEYDSIFGNHDPPEALSAHSSGGSSIVWLPEGPLWRLIRKLAMREMLSPRGIHAFAPLRQRDVHQMIEALREKIGGGGDREENVVQIRELVHNTVLDMLASALWRGSEQAAAVHGEARELNRVIDGLISESGERTVSDFFPVLSPLDLQGSRRRVGQLRSKFDAIFDAMIEHRSETRDGNEGSSSSSKTRDVLQTLLGYVGKDGFEVPFELKHARALILDLVMAGTDTTSLAVEWSMAELLRHPDAIAKVQRELDDVVGTDGCVLLQEAHVPKLQYLESVVKEALRLHPIGPILVPYAPTKDVDLGGYTIPEGASVIVNVWAIHRDPTVWLDAPSQFKPERFLSPSGADVGLSGKWDYRGRSFEYMPFGSGRRVCPGIGLAVRMAVFLLGSLFRAFEWRIPRGMEVDVDADHLGLTLKMKNPLQAIPVWRLKE